MKNYNMEEWSKFYSPREESAEQDKRKNDAEWDIPGLETTHANSLLCRIGGSLTVEFEASLMTMVSDSARCAARFFKNQPASAINRMMGEK